MKHKYKTLAEAEEFLKRETRLESFASNRRANGPTVRPEPVRKTTVIRIESPKNPEAGSLTEGFESFLARCERVEAKNKARNDRALYRSITGSKARPSNRQSVRKESAKRFAEASEIKGRKHQIRNPYWGDGPFNTVRPGRHKN